MAGWDNVTRRDDTKSTCSQAPFSECNNAEGCDRCPYEGSDAPEECDFKEFAVYLHENGHLIVKPKICYASIGLADYFDSDFVKKVWVIHCPQELRDMLDVCKVWNQVNQEDVLYLEKQWEAMK